MAEKEGLKRAKPLCLDCMYFQDTSQLKPPETIVGAKIGVITTKCTLWEWMFSSQTDMADTCDQWTPEPPGPPAVPTMPLFEELQRAVTELEEVVKPKNDIELPDPRFSSGATPGIHIDNATFNMQS